MTMPASERELWVRADALLDRLLDLAEPERAPTLAAMSLPPELLDRVQRLLRAHARSGALEQPLPWVADGESAGERAAGGMVGRAIGGWELQRELGRGGMSVVYLACRGEGAHRQRAALKLLTLGALAGDGLRRFRHEQAILTRLNHPHIAHLHEAGETADGTPYLVIELVEGERIDQWCDARCLSVRERVALVLDVCAALAYAHRNLVVHADLKPSNVLVDGEGHVRVVDFGIGRLLDEELIEATQSRARALTPQYAAPEQLAGARATTAADVFGLGALLYRLLCGRPPRPAAHGRA
ncbi:MAG: serine/threonine-protein kinase, partial [Rhodanobacter sp.]